MGLLKNEKKKILGLGLTKVLGHYSINLQKLEI